ncbi:arylformamidase [Erythrobacter sp. Alg231-14]|uniref:arylformamidase n=1 Tax=Erythrobacter sp. Alg231-14 TaxID=1922225 RepID=UPI00307C02E6
MIDRRIWDISQRISSATPLWPGEPPITVTRHAAIGPDCPVNIGAVSMPMHTGTHADAPLHYSDAGLASADCNLSAYIGSCIVIDAADAGGGEGQRVELEHCDWDAIAGYTRVIIRTYRRFPKDQWDENFSAVAPDVIERMASIGVQLIGIDTPSLDPQTSKTMDAHHAVLAADMRILEGLVLDDVPVGAYELVALPLKIDGADASPVRAILREMQP